MAISRSREFAADETGARLSANPLALASALHKIEAGSQRVPMTAGSPATAHLFIVNPFSGRGLVRLFSTHPSTEARVERLETLARRAAASLVCDFRSRCPGAAGLLVGRRALHHGSLEWRDKR